MQSSFQASPQKGQLALSIDQNILDRLEPYKRHINLSAQAEKNVHQTVRRNGKPFLRRTEFTGFASSRA